MRFLSEPLCYAVPLQQEQLRCLVVNCHHEARDKVLGGLFLKGWLGGGAP